MVVTGWCALIYLLLSTPIQTGVCSQIFNFIFCGCPAQIEYSSGTKKTSEAHISPNCCWEAAVRQKRKASDKWFKLKCFHMEISVQRLLKTSTVVLKIVSPELLGTKNWKSSLCLRWSALLFSLPCVSNSDFLQFCPFCLDLNVSNLKSPMLCRL